MSKFCQSILCFWVVLCVLIPFGLAHAETRFENKTFSNDIILKRVDQPFYFSGYSTVPKGVTVSVEKGTQIFIDGNVFVRGKLVFQGGKDAPVSIKRSATYTRNQKLFTVMGGELHASYTNIEGVSGVLDAYASSTILFEDGYIKNSGVVGDTSVIAVFNNSLLNLNNSTLENILSNNGIEIYNQSSLLIVNSSFVHVGINTSIYAYDSLVSPGQTQSTISIRESLFSGVFTSIHSTSTDFVQTTGKGIEVFNKAYAQIEDVSFESFANAGISSFSGANLEIYASTLTKNKIGINSYNSNIKISESEIFENSERGAVLYGGNIIASNNWWGSESGPYSVNLNPSGQGDVYDGLASISPWKQQKPKKKTKCCSSVLFIPGMQGSRIYKKEIIGENQLWEPNSVSDVSKLYLTKDGYSTDKTLYFRDIIERTNIFFGGNADVEIYRGFVRALDGLNTSYSIEDWQFATYDWRMSPNTIVIEGSRGQNGQYKKMEDQITQMAGSSKTKKVTLIAHSYGGLVTKRFLAYLVQKGKIDLIDKVIFVAVPENGSPSSLFALLHGDNQDIGRGFIVNKAAMRKFAQNMPSVYALLPKINSNIIFGIPATSTISVAVPNIQTVQDIYKFIFKEISRPSTDDWLEINVPQIANKKVKQNIDIESTSPFAKSQTDPAYKDIEFYNISGIGLDTLKSIRYVKQTCSLYIQPALMSSNCGLSHEPIYSLLGDGVVLAEDLLLESSALRWGEKYIFNMGAYNKENKKNYGHSNIISTAPVISTLMQIMLNNIGEYTLPAYITKYGGSRAGGVNTSVPSQVTNALVLSDSQNKKYQISVDDTMFVSAQDNSGNTIGIHFPIMDTDKKTPGSAKVTDVIPVQNTSSNSSISHVGEIYTISTEELPKSISLKPDQEALSIISSTNPISEFNINLKIEEVVYPTSAVNQDNVPSNTVIASFENIPITEYSTVEVQIHSPTNSSSYPQTEMKVTDQYGGVYSNTVTYTSGGSEALGSLGLNSQSSQQSQNTQTLGQTGGSLDIVYLIGLIRTEIQKSGLRANFKQRYILKLNTIEKNYKLILEAKKRLARNYARDTTASLVAIIKDLNRMRSLYYRGGMTKPEASFLYSQFSRLSKAFGD